MYLRTWQAVALLTAVSITLTLMQVPRGTWLTTAALSLSMGVAALTLMGAAAVLGGRIKLLESLFGGLDRVYLTHKWLAIYALVFASIHFTFKAGAPEWETASILTLPPAWTRLVRQLSLLALMSIVMLALNRKIPYHRWRWWHKLAGPLFVIVILHWLSFKSPIELSSGAGLWLAGISALGLAAAAYKLLLYPILSPHAVYCVVSASPGAAALHLELEPVKNPIAFAPGQFAFISIKEDMLREPHPFTIASATNERGRVHFVIRDLGDYTHRLIDRVVPGMHATVYAPFGRFTRKVGAKQEIWIAGGVGISPFIAWLGDEHDSGLERVTLFYFFTPGREFPKSERLREIAERGGVQFVAVPDGPSSEIFLRRFGAIVQDAGPCDVQISFCGPRGLLKRVQTLMRAHGVPSTGLRYEYFEFR